EIIQSIHLSLPDTFLRYLPAEPKEPRGRPALRRLATHLTDPARGHHLLAPPPGGGAGLPGAERPAQATGSVGGGQGGAHTKEPSRSGPPPADPPKWLDRLAPSTLRLLLFGGKGGVGKTTCAAAAALTLAAHRPHARVLLVSTDPAHSLADVLDTSVGDDERPIPNTSPNLRVRELDAVQSFTRWRDRNRGEVGGVLGALTGNTADGEALTRLLDSPPPGVDELLALSYLLEAAAGKEEGEDAFGLVVVDTAPTGHALRLLEMPEAALAWDHALLSLLLKYRQALGLGDFAAGLVDLSKSLKRFRTLLSDPERSRFVAVTRRGELPRRETERLLRKLARLSIPAPTVLLNAVPETPCPWCGPPAGSRPPAGGCDIMTAPAVFPPPRGAGVLAAWARTWKETG
ncbi:MAG TPA: TRC40/GET3/ArsA family transport-energizing ATPase, partial [Thermoanaerobaculia bacterium]|nr:TRC40/GET3/ArsA family transport-energizing ATPase [Thermoanaerobaculia bacterium]